MEAPATGQGIQLEVVLRFVEVAVDALSAAREEIDALNVFPVPDGDTGTNLFLTMSAAREALLHADVSDRAAALAAFERGALLGARGNSGVILSQMLGAIARRLSEATPTQRNADVVVEALERAVEESYAAVGTPIEGTMLTVATAAARAARQAVTDGAGRAREVFARAAEAAREALARTPEQLKVLADAGVVDAGGRGLVAILDAAETVLTGRRPSPVEASRRRVPLPVPLPTDDLVDGGPAYEVMFLLDTAAGEEKAIAAMRQRLAGLGDSLVVVGGAGLWNVHIHVDDVGAAIEAGIAAGRPHRIRVTHFADQIASRAPGPDARTATRTATRTGRAVVAVAAGPGLHALFTEAGALCIDGSPGHRASAGDLLAAILETGAAEVAVLPNDSDTVRAAEIAVRTAQQEHQISARVVPTRAQVQGLAAMAVHDPGRAFTDDVIEMTATATHARHGAVTIAAKRAITMAGPCEPGDALGVVDGDFAVVGDDLAEVALDVVNRLLAGGGELVTLVSGADAGADRLAEETARAVQVEHPTIEVDVLDGGQERYPLLVSVE